MSMVARPRHLSSGMAKARMCREGLQIQMGVASGGSARYAQYTNCITQNIELVGLFNLSLLIQVL